MIKNGFKNFSITKSLYLISHGYNIIHTITISVSNYFPRDNILDSTTSILNSIPNDLHTLSISNLDNTIMNQNKPGNQSNNKENVFPNYHSLTKLVENLQNNLTNIVYSSSKAYFNNYSISKSNIFFPSFI
ncbi:hypothetical protein PIROE2DRAFT_15628 [Piromyces sp. E2]|nr:hypothetical protein PIROE2DRAFT_15628 [Piromyces sp. E2]|eukprot:OUM58967.1 hypothetical protein PIROE2DRAFT_15628 [Piromyces sp. E2]